MQVGVGVSFVCFGSCSYHSVVGVVVSTPRMEVGLCIEREVNDTQTWHISCIKSVAEMQTIGGCLAPWWRGGRDWEGGVVCVCDSLQTQGFSPTVKRMELYVTFLQTFTQNAFMVIGRHTRCQVL